MNQVQRLCGCAQRGDKSAASELVQLFYQKVYNYLRRLSKNTLDAEDLTQETFIKLWLSLSVYRGECAFSTWIHRIAYNVYIDYYHENAETVHKSDQWWQECRECSNINSD